MEIMEKDQLDAADHWAANQDIKNLLAARMRPTLVAVFAEDAACSRWRRKRADWNLEDAEDAAAPLIFQAVLRQLALETFADDMDQDLLQETTWPSRITGSNASSAGLRAVTATGLTTAALTPWKP